MTTLSPEGDSKNIVVKKISTYCKNDFAENNIGKKYTVQNYSHSKENA